MLDDREFQTAVGLYASWTWDFPTGPAIVTAFGAATALVVLGLWVPKLTMRAAALFASAVAVLAGLLLVTFPAMDQPWLDALEDIAPPVQTAFLSSGERFTRNEVLDSIARARAELLRLRALEQDVRWGKIEMEPDKAEQLRQYLAGRSEIAAGDQLVLRYLRGKARERQRLALGLPLLIIGFGGIYAVRRGRA